MIGDGLTEETDGFGAIVGDSAADLVIDGEVHFAAGTMSGGGQFVVMDGLGLIGWTTLTFFKHFSKRGIGGSVAIIRSFF